ncbi:Polyprenol reductase 2 [Camellia lanceoleosa]|uniref:Polyprenol reductase 2 n=1 Tax=Camellia lanceoleosa TaxID=1840588 RepID=A0ACC0IDH2_9ERIC|nr:Polyprenol reductase 2 [Camellia lanceoleosa]
MEEIGFVLVLLLRAAWLAGTLPILIAVIPLSRFNSFHECLLGFAKRGRYCNHLQINSLYSEILQSFLCVGCGVTTLLLVTTWFYAYKEAPLASRPLQYSTIVNYTVKYRYRVWQSVFLLLLMEVQALRRLCESIYVFKYSPQLGCTFWLPYWPIRLYFHFCCTVAPEVFKFTVNQVAEFVVKGKNQIPATEFDWWQFCSL